LKGASDLLNGWPERTNRVLIAIVVVALLLGVPVLSMTVLSVHVDRQTITIQPGSYRSIHFGFYGFGMIEYSISGISGSDVYEMELDRINFYRFVAGKPYQYTMYGSIGFGGSGSSSMVGLIWDEYLVLVNDGGGTASVYLDVDGRAYMSMLPTAAILVTASAAGYWLGRQADKKAHLDMTDPLVMARWPVRRKALKAITVLSLLPWVIMLGFAAGMPADFPLVSAGEIIGFFIGLFVTIIISFQLRFKLTKDQAAPAPLLANLAYRLRVSGYRVTEEGKRLTVQMSSTSAVHITTRQVSDGTWVLYKSSATPSGFSIMIILTFTGLGLPLALALSLFMLYRTSAFASTRVLPRLSQLPVPQEQEIKADTRMMIVESLSEGRRLSSEAYESARSNYHDSVIVMTVIGMVLSVILGILAFTQIDSEDRGLIAFAVGVLSGVAFSAISWFLLAAKSKPHISEFKAWAAKLDAALSREVAGQNPSDSDPSSFELIAISFKEMPKWLKARRRAGGFRKPFFWILIFFLSYGAFEAGSMGLMWLVEGQLPIGSMAITICVVLVLCAVFSNRIWKRRLDQELEKTLSGWNERYEALRSEMERLLVGE
jgi:hypothetical protein